MSTHIAPVHTRPSRLAPLAKLPIFLDLAGKRVLIAGDGEPVAWKAELLAASGARVVVHAEEPVAELLAVAEASDGAVVLVRRRWQPADLDGVTLAVGDIEEADEARAFIAAAHGRAALVNVVDKPAFCDFQFGAIVNRSPVVVGISTDGGAPILGQAIRRRIEAILPAGIGSWGEAAKGFRDTLKTLLPSRAGRRRFWEKFVDVAFISQAEEDARLAELERLARESAFEEDASGGVGEVVIVGAGPGDPGLVTLAAMRELQAADVIVHDRLVTPGVLELARREARRVDVGKKGHGASCRQEDITALVVELALSGNRVVRLKGGDPCIFGRAGEEIEACEEAGVPVRIVPGITTASAAAAALCVSLTDRRHARRLQFVTGHDRNGQLPPDLDLDSLADPAATTVVYMGRRTAAGLALALIERGLAPSTPAIVARNVSRADASRFVTDLAGLVRGAAHANDDAPTLVLIGAALARGAPTRETPIRLDEPVVSFA